MKKIQRITLLTAVFSCMLFMFSACGTTQNENGNRHNEHNYTESIVSPTCTEKGYTLHSCSCGDSYKDHYTDALGHEFVVYNSNHDATCLTDGTKTARCERCDTLKTIIDNGSALGHSFSENWTTDKTAHWHAATCEHSSEIEDYGVHKMSEWRMTKEPTRTTEGLRIKTCALCDYTEEQKIERINYDYTEGLYYKINSEGTGYIVVGARDAYDASLKVSETAAETIAPHCLYNGLPVVGIYRFNCGLASDYPIITEYIKKIIIPETVSWVDISSDADPTRNHGLITLSNLNSIEVSDNNPYFTSQNGILYNKDKTKLWFYPNAKTETSFNVPSSVKEIGTLFGGNLTALNLPDGLVNIGLLDCTNVNNLSLPEGLEKIGLLSCKRVEKFPNSLIYIGRIRLDQSLYKQYRVGKYVGDDSNPYKIFVEACTPSVGAIQEIHPNTIYIADKAFCSCELMVPTGKESFEIPNSVKSIGDNAFTDFMCAGCGTSNRLTFHIGSGLQYIGEGAFNGTPYSQRSIATGAITVTESNQYFSSQDGVLYNKDKTELIAYPKSKSGREYTVSENCKTIAPYAFNNNYYLEKIVLPVGLEKIGNNAFAGDNKLTSITIPDSVIAIGVCAFWGCTGLTSIKIPNGITAIEAAAFDGCSGLTNIMIPKGVISIGKNSFRNCSGLVGVTIPNSVIVIDENAFQNCKGLLSITLPDSVSVIEREAFEAMGGYESAPTLVIGKGVSQIGVGAFLGLLKIGGAYYYKGTSEDWDKIQINEPNNTTNRILSRATRYYYIENEADVPTDGGNYWHYDNDGNIVVW